MAYMFKQESFEEEPLLVNYKAGRTNPLIFYVSFDLLVSTEHRVRDKSELADPGFISLLCARDQMTSCYYN